MDARTLTELDCRHLWHPFTQQQEWVRGEPLIVERVEGSPACARGMGLVAVALVDL